MNRQSDDVCCSSTRQQRVTTHLRHIFTHSSLAINDVYFLPTLIHETSLFDDALTPIRACLCAQLKDKLQLQLQHQSGEESQEMWWTRARRLWGELERGSAHASVMDFNKTMQKMNLLSVCVCVCICLFVSMDGYPIHRRYMHSLSSVCVSDRVTLFSVDDGISLSHNAFSCVCV